MPEQLVSIYLHTSEDNCIARMSKRGSTSQEIEKRINNDRAHFVGYESYVDYTVDGNKAQEDVFRDVMKIYLDKQ